MVCVFYDVEYNKKHGINEIDIKITVKFMIIHYFVFKFP